MAVEFGRQTLMVPEKGSTGLRCVKLSKVNGGRGVAPLGLPEAPDEPTGEDGEDETRSQFHDDRVGPQMRLHFTNERFI